MLWVAPSPRRPKHVLMLLNGRSKAAWITKRSSDPLNRSSKKTKARRSSPTSGPAHSRPICLICKFDSNFIISSKRALALLETFFFFIYLRGLLRDLCEAVILCWKFLCMNKNLFDNRDFLSMCNTYWLCVRSFACRIMCMLGSMEIIKRNIHTYFELKYSGQFTDTKICKSWHSFRISPRQCSQQKFHAIFHLWH